MMEEEFERYWLENRRELLAKNKEYREIEESYKMRLAALGLACCGGNPDVQRGQ